MPPIVDHTSADRSGWGFRPAGRPQTSDSLRLEILETRCLMSGSQPMTDHDIDRPAPTRARPVATQGFIAHDHVSEYETHEANNAASSPIGGDDGSDVSGCGNNDRCPCDAEATKAVTGALPIRTRVERPSSHLCDGSATSGCSLFRSCGNRDARGRHDVYRLTLSAATRRSTSGSNRVKRAQCSFSSLTDRVDCSKRGRWSSGHTVSSFGAGGLAGGFDRLSWGYRRESQRRGIVDRDLQLSVMGQHRGRVGHINRQHDRPGATVATSAIGPGIVGPMGAASTLATLPTNAGSQASSPSPVNGQSGLLVAVGSPATRSARPSGGLLSDGDPTPPAARDFSAAVNKEWDELAHGFDVPRGS